MMKTNSSCSTIGKYANLRITTLLSASLFACLAFYCPSCFSDTKELDGHVSETESFPTANTTTTPANDNQLPSWFGAKNVTPMLPTSTATTGNNQLPGWFGASDVSSPTSSTSMMPTPVHNSNDNLKKTAIEKDIEQLEDGDNRLKALIASPQLNAAPNELTAGAESDWQAKYWDSWWRRFDNAARLRIWWWQKLHDINWGRVNLDVTVSRLGDVNVEVTSYENVAWANVVANAYRCLAHTKTVRFPEWSRRESVEETRDIFVGHGGWHYKTGDYETVNVCK